jgi:hypothetical protein
MFPSLPVFVRQPSNPRPALTLKHSDPKASLGAAEELEPCRVRSIETGIPSADLEATREGHADGARRVLPHYD